MCHEVKIFFNLDFVYGSLFQCHSFLSQIDLLDKDQYQYVTQVLRISETTCSLKYHGLEISGTSGRIKNPLMATGKDITPSMMKSLSPYQHLVYLIAEKQI